MAVIITTGYKYTDIDALACAVGYSELLSKKDIKNEIVLPGILNHSVTESLKIKLNNIRTSIEVSPEDEFVIVDVSDPDQLPDFVNLQKVINIFDHHAGFEDLWQEKIGKNSNIEMIGACATLIYEEWVKNNLQNEMSQFTAELLLHAIVSNTLNFKIGITSDRDRRAFEELLNISNLSLGWIEKYFNEQEEGLYQDVIGTIINDTKGPDKEIEEDPLIFGQLELWNGFSFLENHKKDIEKAMEYFNEVSWLMSIPSISEGKNYLYAKDLRVISVLEEKLNVKFKDNVATTDRLLLRKQIRKLLNNYK